MTKLSELLEAAVCDMFDQANDTVPESVAETDRADARKLRAIAPALVAFSKVAWEPHACIPLDHFCVICRFRTAMKEAGVTCE